MNKWNECFVNEHIEFQKDMFNILANLSLTYCSPNYKYLNRYNDRLYIVIHFNVGQLKPQSQDLTRLGQADTHHGTH